MAEPVFEFVDERDANCIEQWPGCESFGYNPSCCRFPKSCSAGFVGWKELVGVSIENIIEEPPRVYEALVNGTYWLITNGVWRKDPDQREDNDADR